eukprot:SM000245S08179  [mRNA]  locus=s245:147391:150854:+ [translate_table: standard]
MATTAAAVSGAGFNRAAHVEYLRTALGGLPTPYEGQEVNRLTLAYLAVVGLDVLGALDQVDKVAVEDWVYSLQVLPAPHSELEGDAGPSIVYGFRGSPSAGIPYRAEGTHASTEVDGGNLANTYTALSILATLNSDFSRLRRACIVNTIHKLQCADGCFIPVLGGGESDMRFVFCAAAICHILDGWGSIRRDSAMSFILKSKAGVYIIHSYDRGFGLRPGCESHGGATYCALAAQRLMTCKPATMEDSVEPGSEASAEAQALCHMQEQLEPCVSANAWESISERTAEQARFEDAQGSQARPYKDEPAAGCIEHWLAQSVSDELIGWCLQNLGAVRMLITQKQDSDGGGLKGRTNKDADSCYSFWVGASLQMLGAYHLIDKGALRNFLLTCQKESGGFSKWPDAHADLLHTFYSICGLSLLGTPGLQPLCCELGITQRAASCLPRQALLFVPLE